MEEQQIEARPNKEIIPFIYDESPIRVVLDDEKNPWFVAKDVCRALDVADHGQAIEILDDDEKGGYKVPTHQRGMQEAICINEPGLYTLIFRSNKPNAKAFRRWVTHEVLPALHRSGQYAMKTAVFADSQTTIKDLTGILGRMSRIMDRLDKRLDRLDTQEETIRKHLSKYPPTENGDINNTIDFYTQRKSQMALIRDDVRRFLVERTIVNPEAGTLLTWMYTMYEQWCFANCLIPLGRNQFYYECRQALAGYGDIKAARGNKLYVSGLRLRDDKDLYP